MRQRKEKQSRKITAAGRYKGQKGYIPIWLKYYNHDASTNKVVQMTVHKYHQTHGIA